ncbi:MAG: hypothetical protein L6Q47_14415 [Ignavibacteriaceae bacterium]|nr:hypothetical protein [Ignavibacteriaceae bacterium]
MKLHRILIVLLFILPLLHQSCYTVIVIPEHGPPGPTREQEFELNSFYKMDVIPGRDIAGIWSKTSRAEDYGDIIERLEFRTDGTMLYFPHYELTYGGKIEGEYRTVSDTLIVKIRDSYILKKSKFAIEEPHLRLAPLVNAGFYGSWVRGK